MTVSASFSHYLREMLRLAMRVITNWDRLLNACVMGRGLGGDVGDVGKNNHVPSPFRIVSCLETDSWFT